MTLDDMARAALEAIALRLDMRARHPGVFDGGHHERAGGAP